MKVWAVLWGADYEGYSDDIRIFSTKDKVYNYILKELEMQYTIFKNTKDDTDKYYENKFQRLVNALNEQFDHDYITFSVDDFTGFFQIELIEVDKD